MPVKIDIAPEADTVTAMLTGEIDHHGAGRLREAIDDTVRRTCPRPVSYTHLTLPTIYSV